MEGLNLLTNRILLHSDLTFFSFFDVIALPYIYFFLFSYELWCVDAVDILSLEVELYNQVDTWKYLCEIICDLKNIYMNT